LNSVNLRVSTAETTACISPLVVQWVDRVVVDISLKHQTASCSDSSSGQLKTVNPFFVCFPMAIHWANELSAMEDHWLRTNLRPSFGG
jgi:hypothetical protein